MHLQAMRVYFNLEESRIFLHLPSLRSRRCVASEREQEELEDEELTFPPSCFLIFFWSLFLKQLTSYAALGASSEAPLRAELLPLLLELQELLLNLRLLEPRKKLFSRCSGLLGFRSSGHSHQPASRSFFIFFTSSITALASFTKSSRGSSSQRWAQSHATIYAFSTSASPPFRLTPKISKGRERSCYARCATYDSRCTTCWPAI